MEFRHLQCFVAVAEERNFTRAAERLSMAQPPLSQQIRAMEAALGVQLFERTTRRVDLTPAGEALLSRAHEILRAVDRAADETRRAVHGEVGRLAVGFTGSATYAMLPTVATALRTSLPDVRLALHGEMLTPAQVEALMSGRIDIGILRPPVRRRGLTVKVVRREPLIAVLPKGHPMAAADGVAVEQLADDAFVTYAAQDRSVVHDAVERTCEAHGFVPRVALEVSETATLVSFVAAGVGVSLVPTSVAHMTVRGAVYQPLLGDPVHVELAVAWRSDDDSPVVRRALAIARDAIAAAPLSALGDS